MFLLRRIRKRIKGILAILAAVTVAFSVSESDGKNEPVSETQGLILSTTQSETTEASYEESDTTETEKETFIILADDMTTINGEGASFSDGVVLISEGGIYLFKGELNDGRIVVKLKDKSMVTLKFYGARIRSSKGAALSVLKAPKGAELYFAQRTYNTFADTSERAQNYNESEGDSAVIFSKENLTLAGKGNLNLEANFNKGIFSKKDVTVKNAEVSVVSFDDGIRSRGSTGIENSELFIVSGGDGIHVRNEEAEEKGKITVQNSKLTLVSDLDGMDCDGDIQVRYSEMDVVIADGSTGKGYYNKHDFAFGDNNSPDKNKNDIFAGKRVVADSSTYEKMMDKKASLYGIVSGGDTTFKDSIVKINSLQHGISSERIEIGNGYCSIKSDGNGLCSEKEIISSDVYLNIMAYGNGMESENICLLKGKAFISTLKEAMVTPKGNEGVEVKEAVIQVSRLTEEKAISLLP